MNYELNKRVFHFRRPARTSRGVYLTRTSWFVTLMEEESRPTSFADADPGKGGVGVGECAPLPDLSCDALPDDVYESTLRQMCECVCAEGAIPYEALRPYPSMLFGLETAFAQLRGESPFGGCSGFSRGESGLRINGLVWMGTFDEMHERIVEKLQAGFHCVKLKVGAIDWQEELAMVDYVRSRFGGDVLELRLDANGGFSEAEAMARLKELSAYGIHSIEQPIKKGGWAQMRELSEGGLVPIALDEELIGLNNRDEKARMLDAVRPQYIVLKPSLHGGMAGCREWVELARERGIASWLTSALESNVGLRAIGLLAAELYGDTPTLCQGLGTGQLFTDNVETLGEGSRKMCVACEVRGDELWLTSEATVQLQR